MIVHVVHRPHQFPQVVNRIKDFRYPPVNVQEGINSFHRGPDRVFSRKDGVATRRFRKVTDEGQVRRAGWHNRWPVPLLAQHKVRRNKRHVDRHGLDRVFGRVFLDLSFRYAEVVEPFRGDLFPAAFGNLLWNVVPLRIRVEPVNPNDGFIFGLVLKVRLPVDRPG